ncbi:methionyl-tRNA formyltransferase [Spirulina subsalsa]|uniref:methionyl-tRNA formyltransferase n=1 Tax=Spirulina subsalsa TaxID=54311 RepID=UPI000312621B|nr:methionyl-tRNA formyltransferase [Spirulina subsalsa]
MKIIFFGTPQFAVPSLERFLNAPNFEVLAVVTQPDKPRGRGKKLIPSPVKQVALEHHLPVWQPKRVKKDRDTLDFLRQSQADAFVVVAYGQILSPEILALPRLGCINGHGSLLPKYRGAAPIQWCLYHGEQETGMTTMLMDEGMDTGAMLLKSSVQIGLWDNAEEVGKILAQQCADLLPETLEQLDAGTITPTPQNNAEATYAPLIQKEDYELDWTKSAIALHHQIRAFYPNCVTPFRGTPLKILATSPLGEPYTPQLPPALRDLAPTLLTPSNEPPGAILHLVKKQGFVLQTGDGPLLIQAVQPAGKKPQSGWDFVNGQRLTVGERGIGSRE